MKIKKIGAPAIIMSNPLSKHHYFGWPSVARLKNGRIIAGASGYRTAHICPFGKGVVSYSENEGETYTIPAPVIDTPMDDRDIGFAPFGENGLIVTSFTNKLKLYRDRLERTSSLEPESQFKQQKNYRAGYLEVLTDQDEEAYCSSYFRISNDNGITFGPLFHSPVTSPHGPTELNDGSVLWVGSTHISELERRADQTAQIEAYSINTENGAMEFVGRIDTSEMRKQNIISCEPHAIQLSDGSILCHIRAQRGGDIDAQYFTLFQARSFDGGKTWTRPMQILGQLGGAPSHLMIHSSGKLVCSYAKRHDPIGIYVMFSDDLGETWDIDHAVYQTDVSADIGYPCTIDLNDGGFLTVFYAHENKQSPAVIWQQKWRMEEL